MRIRSISRSVMLVLVALGLSSCFSLDSNLLDPGDSITEYRLSRYTGNVDFRLDSSYAIPSEFEHVVMLNSRGINESSPTRIFGVYLGDTSRIGSDTIILYSHGYSHHMDFYYPRAQLLASMGGKNRFGVMMLDYRGFGLSDGEPTEEGLYSDVDAAIEWLKERGLTGDRLILYGFSLGCAPATYLAAHPRSLTPHKLILESPFASAENLAQDASGLNLPGSMVTNLKLDNVKEIEQVTQPFLWMHGTSDQFINIKTNGEVVFAHYRGPYSIAYRVAGADHSTVPQTFGFEQYRTALQDFILRP